MKDFRIAVGNSLKGKIGEHVFFLQQIADITKIIRQKHTKQDYPINTELDKLNYFFSAYLNSIQSIKDSCQRAMDVNFPWKSLSPTYGNFIFYCRNAATHDGYHLINADKEGKNYIAGPLRRIDNNNKIIEFPPPKEDVLTLCLNISTEMLASLGELLKQKGDTIPVAEEADFMKDKEILLASDFIPDEIKGMIRSNDKSIEASFKGVKINIVAETVNAITSAETLIADLRSI